MKCQKHRAIKIGSMVLAILSFVIACVDNTVFAQERITLHAIDSNGDQTSTVAAQVPFELEITIESSNGNTHIPQIKGIKQFIVEDKTHASTINTIINGVRSVKNIYRYVVRAAQEGTYEIGPAYLDKHSSSVESNAIKITVVKAITPSARDPFLQLVVDKDHVYIGEQISCAMRFFIGKSTKLDGISQPQFPDFTATKLEGPFPGTQDVRGVVREYVEWRTVLTANKAGTIDIPAIAAIFKVPSNRRSSSMFGFPSLFDDPFQQKQVYSNALKITVKPLPEHAQQKKCFAVGFFKLALISLDAQQAKEGEGVVLKLSVVGKGSIVRFPVLQLPDDLQYYESKQYIDAKASSPHGDTHVFEYIVQGKKAGQYTIAQQACMFFDPIQEQYKQVRTDRSLPLKIIPLAKTPDTGAGSTKKSAQPLTKDETKETPTTPTIYASYLISDWYERPVSVPFIFFISLVMICIVYMTVRFALRIYTWYAHKNSDRWRVKKAGSHALKRLMTLEHKHATQNIYDIFVDFFAERTAVPCELVDESYITNIFKKHTQLRDQLSAWNEFYQKIAFAKYGGHANAQEAKHIFQESKKWIQFLEKSL